MKIWTCMFANHKSIWQTFMPKAITTGNFGSHLHIFYAKKFPRRSNLGFGCHGLVFLNTILQFRWKCTFYNDNQLPSIWLLFTSSKYVSPKVFLAVSLSVLSCELNIINAEVAAHVAGSLEAEGLPGYPQMPTCWNKRDDALTKLFITSLRKILGKTRSLKLSTKC